MGWLILVLVIFVFIRGLWNLLFKPIFLWLGDTIMTFLQEQFGMNRIAARAALSAIMIVAILILIGLG